MSTAAWQGKAEGRASRQAPSAPSADAVYGWGYNDYGELGDGMRTNRDTPGAVSLAPTPGVTATAVSAGYLHSLALGSDDQVYAWGWNGNGQLGDGTTTDHRIPEAVSLAPGVTATAVSAGYLHSLAVGSDGQVYAWGYNYYGELGDGTTTERDTPEAVRLAPGVTALSVSAGEGHSLAVGSDGQVYAWGLNGNGELGDGTTTSRDTPEAVSLASGVSATAVSAGYRHSLAVGSDGQVYAWGSNYDGELGDGTTMNRDTPEAVSLAPGVTALAVSAGEGVTDYEGHSLAVGADTAVGLANLPANLTVNATSPAGAVVSYTPPSAVDEGGDSSAAAVNCTGPASGSTFPIGITTVTCTVTDSDDTNSLVSASFTVTVQDTTPPTLLLPANLTVEATGPSGAAVTYSASATDLVDGTDPVACTPASGATFPLGTTTVNCTSSDAHGNTAAGSFTVTVQDTTPPTLQLPANLTVDATSPAGAAVTYTATATDLVDGTDPVTCTPASGATFPLGTTTVNCASSDAHGNTATGSFTVTVKGAVAQLDDLLGVVNSLPIASGLKSSLDSQLQAVLTDLQANNTTRACKDLSSFVKHVESQSGKGLTTAHATQLLAAASNIMSVLAC